MKPTIGRIVIYRLSNQDAEAMERRRTTGASIAERIKKNTPDSSCWPLGAQAHIGNPLYEGAEVPMVIIRVWPDEFGTGIPGVNGQAFLDGNDSLWVTSVKEGNEPGTWHWPERV